MEKEAYMHRALQLARLGIGKVAPNPMVGAVIVYQDKIIGEGWHEKYGLAHAEVNAINSVKQKELLSESTIYVNLEPCSHYGKTPPCANLLVDMQLKKVVIANLDSNPQVAGRGIELLRQAGIDVQIGVLAEEARLLNKRFFTFMEKKRPYIILKWAETADGFIAPLPPLPKWISNEVSKTLVHKWRSEEAGIMVGTNTVIQDNPQLNVRLWQGRPPVRIVIDKFLRTPPHFHIFDKTQKTICYNLLKNEEFGSLAFVRLDAEDFLANLLNDLFARNIQSVLVEGGTALLQSFIDKEIWDEARVFVSRKRFSQGILAPNLCQKPIAIQNIQEDLLYFYSNAAFYTP
ncbi:MAG: bifunctional diaminohydroxyphosphoribosylaminopyrimidine deaminase/5-amino-6-(5-phosphoribosylamino)uracil reductase RibD [Thermonemataceae bacterium]|nr:bifunctional diaminohydroxyphosphoribosylaminopyrimidine deaminase/5-amino-6-(5-phosphoribosylamino)uracil reductase RibD [Thermonemataceae bacterium]